MARALLSRRGAAAWLAVAALLALLGLSVFMLLRLRINNAPDVYFPPNDPAVVLNRALHKEFPEDQFLVVLFEGSDIYTPHFLRALNGVARSLQANPLVNRVFTPTTMDRISGTADGFAVKPLVDVQHLDQKSPEQIRAQVLSDRFAPGLVVAKDGSAIAMVVRPKHLNNSLQRLALERKTLAAVHQAGLSSDVAAVTGQVALDVAELRSMVRDTELFVPTITVVGLLLIWWLFRRWIAVILSAVTLATVVSFTLALLAAWGQPYALVSAIIPPFMLALTIALLIHFMNALVHLSSTGYEGGQRVDTAVSRGSRPMFFATLTTAAGLFSLALSPIQPIKALGIVCGVGMVFMYLVVTRLLPPLLRHWDRRHWPVARGSLQPIDRMVRWATKLAIRRAGWVVLACVAMLALGAPFIFRVRVETDLYRFFGPHSPLTKSTRLVEQKLTGVSTLEVVFDAPQRDGLKAPERLEGIEHFQHWLNSLPQVDRTMSFPDLVEQMNWAFHAQKQSYRRIPDSRRLISQYLFIYDGQDLYDFVNRDFQRTLVAVNLKAKGATEIARIIQTIRKRLKAHPVADLKWHISGPGRLFADQQDLLVRGQMRSLWSALGLIFIMMIFVCRSVRHGALCMVPNIVPIALIFIVMGALGIWLDMATAMIASIAVGIAVDDTIHIYHAYATKRRAGCGLAASLMRAYQRAGRAVVATTLILSVQFLLLVASSFVPTKEFGLLTAIGLLSALVFDLLLLPALLVLSERFHPA
ncbi:MAG TPA: MMPL family transporter [Gammaproteobacteria bacterium]|nr:MMPL family transporter [Gammaproteobacteria bacterium]